ncbi:MAG: hypothetical protein ACM31C_27190 [Acidobacteriota bacterium]
MTIRDHVFLELALGLRSTLARVDRLLDRHAPEHGAGAPAELDDTTAALLGVIAIRNRLAAACDALPADGGHDERAPVPDLPHESWLR